MPRTTRSPRAPLRQRVTWEDVTAGKLEILEDTFTRTRDCCPRCGARGLWTADPDYAHVCPRCEKLIYSDRRMVRAAGFWLTIVRQLQLAEKAAA